jgi:hypothetical protein
MGKENDCLGRIILIDHVNDSTRKCRNSEKWLEQWITGVSKIKGLLELEY